MQEAVRVASRLPGRPWPNPPVGALVVRDGAIVGRGAHLGPGKNHAEVVALREAGTAARGATLYSTLEPCNHQGRTPPCAPVVVGSGIARVVIGTRDPNPHVAGGGLDYLRAAGVAVDSGILEEETRELIRPFVATRAFERPFVLLKTASSIDGFLAPPPGDRLPGQPAYLTGIEARRDVHRLRRWCDVVLVGEGTMSADRPQLDGRLADCADEDCPAMDPLPAYVDTDLSLGLGWERPHIIFAGRESPCAPDRAAISGQHVVRCAESGGHADPASLLHEFHRAGGHCLMVEGGPTLASSLLRAGVVDRWIVYVAPCALGSGVRWPEADSRVGFELTRVERLGPDAKLVFDRISQ